MSIARFCVALACPLVACGPALAQAQFLVSDWSGSKVVRFHWPSGQPIDHFIGAGISPLNYSGYMAIGPDNKLYVASVATHSILRYDLVTGEYLGAFVPSGSGGLVQTGQFEWHVDPADGQLYLYVCSWDNSSVLRYNGQTGVFKNAFISAGQDGLNGVWGLVFDDAGDLLVTSTENDKVLRFDSKGKLVDDIPVGQTGLDHPEYLVKDKAGKIYVSGQYSSSVIVIDAQDNANVFVTSGTGGLDGAMGMAFDPDGNLLVCSINGSGKVLKYDGKFGQYLGTLIVGTDGGMSGDPFDILFLSEPDECKADFDGNGILDLFDFLAFVNAFNSGC